MFRSSVATPPTEVLPGVNALVKVAILPPPTRDGQAVPPPGGPGPASLLHLPTRVEDIRTARRPHDRTTLVYVAAPRYAGDLDGPEPGSPCRVIWTTPNGLFDLPTRYRGRSLVAPAVRAWRLMVDGPVVRIQRRRYFRVPWVGPVTLEVAAAVPAGVAAAGVGATASRTGVTALRAGSDPSGEGSTASGDGLQVLTGMTVDLSEGGLRVALPAPGLPDGTAIRVLLPVHEQVLVLPATTVWNRPARVPGGHQVETGISFDDVEEHGDLLRHVVVEAQLKARRAGLR